jgi:hypothetical protein
MMERIEGAVTGGCQCGAVRYRATAMLDNAHLCHCRMCQKAVGGLFAALVAAPDVSLSFTRGVPATFRSSDHVERGFCAACGTPLFFRAEESGRTNLTMGSLDRPAAFPPRVQAGVEARVSWWREINDFARDETTEAGLGASAVTSIRQSSRQHPDYDT